MRANIWCLIICFQWFVPLALHAQRAAAPQPADTIIVAKLVERAREYLGYHPDHEISADSAIYFLTRAEHVARDSEHVDLRMRILANLGEAFIKGKKMEIGKNYFNVVIRHYANRRDKPKLLETWTHYALSYSKGDSHFYVELVDSQYFEEMMSILKTALSLSRELNDLRAEAAIQIHLGDFYCIKSDLKSAETAYMAVLGMKGLPAHLLQNAYGGLLFLHYYRGNFERALFYGTEALALNRGETVSADADQIYFYLGNVYRDYFAQLSKAMESYRKSLAIIEEKKDYRYAYPFLIKNMARIIILQGNPSEALTFVINQQQLHPPVSIIGKAAFEESLGLCYDALGRQATAGAHFENMLTYVEQLDPLRRVPSYYGVAMFYLRTKEYKRSKFFLEKMLKTPDGSIPIQIRKNIYYMSFKVDSICGDYLSAIRNFERFKSLGDSVFNEARGKQIEEFLVKYETIQKEKAIQQLSIESKQAHEKLRQANTTRNIIIGAVVLLVFLLAISYNRYLINQRNNRLLESQKKEVVEKNDALETVVREKEWLLKEIHHRVKNNLQIVMSLLNTQSAYINNDAALAAVRHSQQRMYAMSLIHQKLYESDNVAQVDIHSYVRELTQYLRDIYDAIHVGFALDICDVQLDISQAVPLGLILNEAITNSIKYAFPGRKGTVTIITTADADDRITIRIKDDGIGLPQGFNIERSQTLGLNLIRGLAKQLSGTIDFKVDDGFQVSLSFVKVINGHFLSEDVVTS